MSRIKWDRTLENARISPNLLLFPTPAPEQDDAGQSNGGITRYPGIDFPDAPFEPTLRAHLHTQYQFLFGLANDELGYFIPKAEWDDRPPWLQNKKDRWYGEVNSAGEEVAGAVTRALVRLMEESH